MSIPCRSLARVALSALLLAEFSVKTDEQFFGHAIGAETLPAGRSDLYQFTTLRTGKDSGTYRGWDFETELEHGVKIARVQGLMSFHDPASELSALNAAGHLRPVVVDAWTRHVITEAVRLGHASGGVFDIAVAPALMRWGFLPGGRSRAGEEGATFRDVELHADGCIGFRRPLRLDLGGIAKGFAVDTAVAFLLGEGVAEVTVNAGGDLRFGGVIPETIAVRRPGRRGVFHEHVPMCAPAVASSAACFATRRRWGRRVSHILHPGTRRPLGTGFGVSVFAEKCLLADALTKVALPGGPELCAALLRREGASACFFNREGEVTRFPAAAA